jgi:hypothetical protein
MASRDATCSCGQLRLEAAGDRHADYARTSPEDIQDGALAYARFAAPSVTRYRNGLLPH